MQAISEISSGYVKVLNPWQAAPPLEGAGLLQNRDLDFLPASFPQVFEHAEYGPHAPHCPS